MSGEVKPRLVAGRQGHSRVVQGVLVVVAAVLVILPDLLRLDAYVPFAQLVAFRPQLMAVGLALAGLVALRRNWRPAAVGLAVVALVGGALLVPRAVAGGAAAGPAPDARTLTVLALNVKNGSADLERVAGMIRRLHPDLVSLPESGPRYAAQLRAALEGTGYRVRSAPDGTVADVDAVTVAVAPTLGAVRVVAGPRGVFPSLEVSGGALGRLRFVAFHAAAPVPARMDGWVGDLQLLRQWCDAVAPALVAGDFNATLDHSVFRRAISGCRDAAAELGRGLVGTWPSGWPSWLGPQIDHVLTTEALAPVELRVLEVPGTNHRALVVRITRAGNPR